MCQLTNCFRYCNEFFDDNCNILHQEFLVFELVNAGLSFEEYRATHVYPRAFNTKFFPETIKQLVVILAGLDAKKVILGDQDDIMLDIKATSERHPERSFIITLANLDHAKVISSSADFVDFRDGNFKKLMKFIEK